MSEPRRRRPRPQMIETPDAAQTRPAPTKEMRPAQPAAVRTPSAGRKEKRPAATRHLVAAAAGSYAAMELVALIHKLLYKSAFGLSFIATFDSFMLSVRTVTLTAILLSLIMMLTKDAFMKKAGEEAGRRLSRMFLLVVCAIQAIAAACLMLFPSLLLRIFATPDGRTTIPPRDAFLYTMILMLVFSVIAFVIGLMRKRPRTAFTLILVGIVSVMAMILGAVGYLGFSTGMQISCVVGMVLPLGTVLPASQSLKEKKRRALTANDSILISVFVGIAVMELIAVVFNSQFIAVLESNARIAFDAFMTPIRAATAIALLLGVGLMLAKDAQLKKKKARAARRLSLAFFLIALLIEVIVAAAFLLLPDMLLKGVSRSAGELVRPAFKYTAICMLACSVIAFLMGFLRKKPAPVYSVIVILAVGVLAAALGATAAIRFEAEMTIAAALGILHPFVVLFPAAQYKKRAK